MKVDRNEKYKIDNYSFENFCNLDAKMIEQIRIWRNSPEIRMVMYNTNEISEEQHWNFVNSLKNDDSRYYWLVLKDNVPLGVLNIVDINVHEGSCQLGYYLLPCQINSGVGLEFVSKLVELIFRNFEFKSIFGRTELKNKNALFINYCLGFKPCQDLVNINGVEFVEQNCFIDDYFNHFRDRMSSKDIIRAVKDFNELYKSNLLRKSKKDTK